MLFYLAVKTIKLSGHRYGSFLKAARAAAEYAVYITYLEQGRTLRKTGLLHHIEPKRVKAIVREVEAAVSNGQSLRIVGSQEPQYLIRIPYLWKERFPWEAGNPRISLTSLTPMERAEIESSVPPEAPNALIIAESALSELVQEAHLEYQDCLAESEKTPFSESLAEHIKYRLVHSGTVRKLDSPHTDISLYALAQSSYAPKGHTARLQTMFDDVDRYVGLLDQWVDTDPDDPVVFRGFETLEIPQDQQSVAFKELDVLLRAWADRFHVQGAHPIVIQVAAGPEQMAEPGPQPL
ncbi:heterocyst differentiation control protein [Romeria aff. gracilis LEGE 07310]|uniref:Heterocyst differentiation control protein n=1 Tax=Vasconcelosia minhoensis LEGE 07310 TaxID=915328 RepID=A0A8J7DRH2_9CYAN|nr:heterocyst differentiation control protein [Romeria gracilis]MBE9078529.1 heterocyst differentiation control protein [Romeria aff. gracilis LEGE 07310]